jgi:hypothetical protein
MTESEHREIINNRLGNIEKTLSSRLSRIEVAIAGTLENPKSGMAWQLQEMQEDLRARPCEEHRQTLSKLTANQKMALAAWGGVVFIGTLAGTFVWQWIGKNIFHL